MNCDKRDAFQSKVSNMEIEYHIEGVRRSFSFPLLRCREEEPSTFAQLTKSLVQRRVALTEPAAF